MAIRVVMAGATGWVGRAMIPAILAQGDITLTGAVARNAAGQDSGSALGLAGFRLGTFSQPVPWRQVSPGAASPRPQREHTSRLAARPLL